MAYDGWLRLGGTELVNNERLAAYLANGVGPLDARIDVDTCDGLAAALVEDWEPYRTPMQDEPPWYDVDDPDSWDFSGILVTDLTGLDDTTRTLEVAGTLSGNGIAGRALRTPRTVGATAVLVGRTTEACQVGLTWLQRTLYGGCDADTYAVTPGADLEFLTACPGPLTRTADMAAAPILLYTVSDSVAWSAYNAGIDYDGDGTIFLHPFDSAPGLDGGTADSPEDEYVEGGGAIPAEDLYDGGTAQGLGSAVLRAEMQSGCRPGPVTVTWTVRGVYPGEVAQAVIVDESGAILDYGEKWDLNDDAFPAPGGDFSDFELTWELPFGIDADTWAPALVVEDTVQVLTVTVTGQPLLDIADCLAPTLRYLPGTVCTSGPTITQQIDTGCEILLVVEWLWVSRSPYRYGPPTRLVTGLTVDADPTYTAPGVSTTYEPDPIVATPWNCSPPAEVAGCAIDPAAPVFGDAPALPVIIDDTRPRITNQYVQSLTALIGPEQIPASEGVLTFTLRSTSEDPISGARIRVYDDAEADGTVPDNCDFAYEFLIDYLPVDGVMTLTADSITTVCAGLTTPQDASPGVRGAYGGPIEPPVVRCNRRYLVLIQWLYIFTRDALPFYESGFPEGMIAVDIDVSPREG